MKPLRLGFIGGGINSAVGRAHYAACRMDGKFEVVAGHFSRDPAINEATGEAFNCATVSVPDLLRQSDTNVDAIVILTPTPSHYIGVSHALARGIPVICEKALASTSAESDQLIQARDQCNGFLAVTYNYTGYPLVRELRDMVLSGELGGIVSIQAEMPQEGYLRKSTNPQDWRKQDGEIPSVHLDLGTHLHHLIHYITEDRPSSLVAHQSSKGAFGVIDDVQCIAEYQSGFTASLWFGKTAIGHRNGLRIRINGSKASAEWVQENPEELYMASAEGSRWIMDRSSPECVVAKEPRYQRFKAGHPAGFIEAYANLYADLAEWLHAHKQGEWHGTLTPHMYSAEIAHEGLVMMEAMVKSAKEKQWITM
jgi:predicted dehydrogenase